MGLILSLVYGAVAGWIASTIMATKGGLIKNIIFGVVGGLVGGFIAQQIGLTASGFIGNLLISVAGACIVIWLGKTLFK
ncbi:MAG: GlsB/YeaQ/YmgE family stress response membrane protein [Firmicutes bacterium]|nr:GlsB/YeaQ/YmgE family stress response membrane protein [Bacillota bacterium]